MSQCFIALGSNLGNNRGEPIQQLNQARHALQAMPQTELISCSSIYTGPALTLEHQRSEIRQNDYLNAVIEINTTLSPIECLDALQAIEHSQGRIREERWGARTLDLDILLYNQHIINNSRLTVPHYDMLNRDFVLIPLYQIAPSIHIPGQSSTLEYYIAQLKESSLRVLGEFDGKS